nr:MAG TPA: DNA pilot protein VP2 [Microviridae sp.]
MNKRASREAQRTRDWQTSEREAAQAAQDDQIKKNLRYSYEYENAMKALDFSRYYSPAARMQALKEAGLNPDLAYGSASGGTMPGASSPTMASGAASAPSGSVADVAAGSPLISQGIQSFADAPRRIADLNLIDSQVQKNKSDSRKSDSEVLLNGSRIELTKAQSDWTKEDKNRILTDIRNMDIEANKLNAEIDKLRTDQAFVKASTKEKEEIVKELQSTLSDRVRRYAYQNRKTLAEAGVSEKVIEYYTRGLDSMIDSLVFNSQLDMNEVIRSNRQRQLDDKLYKLDNNERTALEIMQDISVAFMSDNSQLLSTQLAYLRQYGDWQAVVGMISQVLNSLSSGVSAYASARSIKPGVKPVTVTGVGYKQ